MCIRDSRGFARFLTRGLGGAVPFILFLIILFLVRDITNHRPFGKALRAIDVYKRQVMDIETVTEENVDNYYRSDMPDSYWVLTELDDSALEKLYK